MNSKVVPNTKYLLEFLYDDAVMNKDWRMTTFYLNEMIKVEAVRYDVISKGQIIQRSQQYKVAEKEKRVQLLKEQNKFLLFLGIILFLIISAAFIIIVYIRKLKAKRNEMLFQQQIKEMENVLVKYELNVFNAHERLTNERRMIARTLHDNISGGLASLTFAASEFEHNARHEQDKGNYLFIKKEADDLYKDLRNYSHHLFNADSSDEIIPDFDLLDYINKVQMHFNSLNILNVNANTEDPVWQEINSGQSKCLYFILKECLTNVVKHAFANNVWINLRCQDGKFILLFRDDGKGFKPGTIAGGMGMENINTYVQELKGDLVLQTSGGTSFTFTF